MAHSLVLWTQAIHLFGALRKRHTLTDAACRDLLYLLEALLPSTHNMPPSIYLLRKWARAPLHRHLDKGPFLVRDMCRDHECGHVYSKYPGSIHDKCPRCDTTRFRCDRDPVWGGWAATCASRGPQQYEACVPMHAMPSRFIPSA